MTPLPPPEPAVMPEEKVVVPYAAPATPAVP